MIQCPEVWCFRDELQWSFGQLCDWKLHSFCYWWFCCCGVFFSFLMCRGDLKKNNIISLGIHATFTFTSLRFGHCLFKFLVSNGYWKPITSGEYVSEKVPGCPWSYASCSGKCCVTLIRFSKHFCVWKEKKALLKKIHRMVKQIRYFLTVNFNPKVSTW